MAMDPNDLTQVKSRARITLEALELLERRGQNLFEKIQERCGDEITELTAVRDEMNRLTKLLARDSLFMMERCSREEMIEAGMPENMVDDLREKFNDAQSPLAPLIGILIDLDKL